MSLKVVDTGRTRIESASEQNHLYNNHTMLVAEADMHAADHEVPGHRCIGSKGGTWDGERESRRCG